MRNSFVTALVVCVVSLAVIGNAQAQTLADDVGTRKLAQTGFKFLTVSVDPRSAAMGDAVTAMDIASSVALFHNPATMSRLTSAFHVAAGQTRWIADIDYNMASLAFRPANGAYGVFGVSLVAVSYGEVIGTVRADNEQGYLRYDDIGLANPSPTALSIGIGYAREITDRFAAGGQVKYATQSLGAGALSGGPGGYLTNDYEESTLVYDFGVTYRTGFRSLNFAMSARNFAPELTFVEENFELPLSFQIGLAMDVMDFTEANQEMHSFFVSVDAERPRDYAERLKIGGEYVFMNTLAVRGGYAYPSDEQAMSLGVGLTPRFGDIGFSFDYAYTSFGIFNSVHRLALQFSF